MNPIRIALATLALAFMLSGCAEKKAEPELITDTQDCSDESRFKEGCN
jgi:uncharacterized protein YgiB involved in biofilm formation